jgi:hypothetical protein
LALQGKSVLAHRILTMSPLAGTFHLTPSLILCVLSLAWRFIGDMLVLACTSCILLTGGYQPKFVEGNFITLRILHGVYLLGIVHLKYCCSPQAILLL